MTSLSRIYWRENAAEGKLLEAPVLWRTSFILFSIKLITAHPGHSPVRSLKITSGESKRFKKKMIFFTNMNGWMNEQTFEQMTQTSKQNYSSGLQLKMRCKLKYWFPILACQNHLQSFVKFKISRFHLCRFSPADQ